MTFLKQSEETDGTNSEICPMRKLVQIRHYPFRGMQSEGRSQMPLEESLRISIRDYCKQDLQGGLQWHIDQFPFINDIELQKRLGRAYYCSRYVGKLMEALLADGDEIHPFIKFQIMQYASIYEAVINHLLWGRYADHIAVQALETHKTYRKISALAKPTKIFYEGKELFTCELKDEKTRRNSIAFKDKVDCAVKIGFVEEIYAQDIKRTFELRNLAHIEAEAEQQIEVEIEHAKTGYWRLKPFLEKIIVTLAESDTKSTNPQDLRG